MKPKVFISNTLSLYSRLSLSVRLLKIYPKGLKYDTKALIPNRHTYCKALLPAFEH